MCIRDRHQDEATPHLHIDFIPYVTDWKGKGMDTRVSPVSYTHLVPKNVQEKVLADK